MAGTYVGPTPGSGQYGLFKAQADAAYASAQAKIAAQRSQLLQSQGLTGQYDANGNYTGFRVDANDPTGGYQMMQQANAQAGAANDAAIGALGFRGGLATQASEAAQQGYSANAASWAQQFLSSSNDLNQQQVDATTQHNSDLFNGLYQSIQDAIASGTYNPADYSGISIDGQTFTPPPGSTPVSTPGTNPFKPPAAHPPGWTGLGAYGFGRGLHGAGPRKGAKLAQKGR